MDIIKWLNRNFPSSQASAKYYLIPAEKLPEDEYRILCVSHSVFPAEFDMGEVKEGDLVSSYSLFWTKGMEKKDIRGDSIDAYIKDDEILAVCEIVRDQQDPRITHSTFCKASQTGEGGYEYNKLHGRIEEFLELTKGVAGIPLSCDHILLNPDNINKARVKDGDGPGM